MPKSKLTPYEFRNKYTKTPLKKSQKPIKRSPIKKSSKLFVEENVKPLKRKTPIKKVSDKRAKQLREYAKERKIILGDRKKCEANLKGCTKVGTELHHMAGKENDLLTDKENILVVCRSCHDKITTDSKMAIAKGLSKSRHKQG